MKELAVIEQKDIVSVFTTENGVDVLFEQLANEVRAEVPDLTTKKGRDRIASLAYKVSKSKGVVDEHGKELVSAEKARLALIDADRKKWRDKCDALRDEIRQPLTDWENAEKQRLETHESNIGLMQCLANVDGLHSDLIASRLAEAENIAIGDEWQEFANKAAIAKDATIKALKTSLDARASNDVFNALIVASLAIAALLANSCHSSPIAMFSASANRDAIKSECKPSTLAKHCIRPIFDSCVSKRCFSAFSQSVNGWRISSRKASHLSRHFLRSASISASRAFSADTNSLPCSSTTPFDLLTL